MTTGLASCSSQPARFSERKIFMVQKVLKINNKTGLHLRPAESLCSLASKFSSRVTFRHERSLVNAKSVISVLGARVKNGDEIELYCEGDDEVTALAAIEELIANMGV